MTIDKTAFFISAPSALHGAFKSYSKTVLLAYPVAERKESTYIDDMICRIKVSKVEWLMGHVYNAQMPEPLHPPQLSTTFLVGNGGYDYIYNCSCFFLIRNIFF